MTRESTYQLSNYSRSHDPHDRYDILSHRPVVATYTHDLAETSLRPYLMRRINGDANVGSLKSIVEKAQKMGYPIDFDSGQSTIKTRNGEVKVLLTSGEGQPHYNLGMNEIYLFSDNEDPARDLVHEREHFQIFPYDVISFGLLYGGAMVYSIHKIAETSGWVNATLCGLAELFWASAGKGLNLYQDTIIHVRQKMGLDKTE